MDTKEFLDTVLPSVGYRCIGAISRGVFSNHFGRTNDWLADGARRINAAGADAYYGCASFREKGKRTQANVAAVRSFWLDIDTNEGKTGQAYDTRRDALQQVTRFANEIGWPAPLVVSSGYGLHCYWPLTHDIDGDTWKETATLLKAATKTWGLAVDQSRTSDSASILRPVGVSNYKQPSQPRSVKVIMPGAPTEHDALRAAVETWLGERGSLPSLGNAAGENLNSDLVGERNYAPASGRTIPDQCAVLAEVRDHPEQIEQPLWFQALGLLTVCTDGQELAHEWSKGHPDYTYAETQATFERAKGPTLCSTFSDHRPAKCGVCPHNGNIRSPIMLGKEYTKPDPTPAEAVDEAPSPPLDPGTRHILGDYFWGPSSCNNGKNALYRRVLKTSSEPDAPLDYDHKLVSDVLFTAEHRVRSSDDNHSMTLHMRDNQGQAREFTISNGVVAEAGSTMFSELGSKEISVSTRNKPELGNYLAAWVSKLRDEHAATPSIEQFGWHNDGFVVGQDFITRSGRRKAMLNASASRFESHFGAHGELEPWVRAVDRAYNYAGQEALQFCVLLAFASPLWPLFGENGGVTVYAHSAGSGYGKTTAQQVGLSAWGYYPELVLRESNFTEGALYQHIGVMKNLPVVIDEMTNCSTDFASKLVYNMSAGKGKSRLTSDANMRKSLNWSTIAAASGNNLLTEKLSLHRANAEAEMARVWEFTVTRKGQISPNEALELFGTFSHNYGFAGRAFIEYVVKHLDGVKQRLIDKRREFNTRENIQQGERYWSALNACVLVALDICREQGLVNFSVPAMEQWIGNELRQSRIQILGSVNDPLEQFGDMLSDLWGGILVTQGEGNLGQGVHAHVVGHPRTAITGRSIIGDKFTAEKLFISLGAARSWCNKLGVSLKEMHESLVKAGWADKQVKRVSLGKGTEQYSGLGGPVKCWDINPSAVRAVMGSHPVAQKVHKVLVGGVDVDGRDGVAGV